MTVPDILKRPSREEELKARARGKGLAKAAKAFGGHIRSGQTAEQRNIRAARVGVQVNRAIAKIQAEQKRKGAAVGREAAAEMLRKRLQGKKQDNKRGPDWLRGEDRFAGFKALGKFIKSRF